MLSVGKDSNSFENLQLRGEHSGADKSVTAFRARDLSLAMVRSLPSGTLTYRERIPSHHHAALGILGAHATSPNPTSVHATIQTA